jgi:4-alpha-glucanotransferase
VGPAAAAFGRVAQTVVSADAMNAAERISSGRSAGVQLHITSLPSGGLGADAFKFVDWLTAAGQSWWQVLPLGPPDRWRSPYRSRSAFACWRGLLARPAAEVSSGEEADFRARESYWIDDWERAAGRQAVRDQVRFEREWLALRGYAAAGGVRLIGDVPLYVGPASVDLRTHPRLFAEDLLAGAPPDDFNATGQLWGNPIFEWPAMRREGYRWWVERLRRAAELFDLVRLDHFRGLVAYWAVPAGARDARAGRWRRGPGAAPLLAARAALGRLPLIAEDLGVITPPVEALRRELDIPGMAVLQFLFDPRKRTEDHLVEGARGRVLYTGTHDQDTLAGWWRALAGPRLELVQAALRARGISEREAHRGLIRLAMSAPAPLVMTQMQDLLGLPSSARMNTPGRAAGNWRWRLEAGALSARVARRLRLLTAEAGRLP